MEEIRAGKPYPLPKGRTAPTNVIFTRYRGQDLRITPLDRDDIQAQNARATCVHCGATVPQYDWDHLIPRSRLQGMHLPLDLVRSCPGCNRSRGAQDLMGWYLRRGVFPSLRILRRYLKLCIPCATTQGLIDTPVGKAIARGLAFDPRALPEVAGLVLDYTEAQAKRAGKSRPFA